MADSLFNHHNWAQTGQDVSGLFRGLAQGAGADPAKYDPGMQGQRYAGRIAASYQEGEQRGVNGTPTFFVNSRPYPGRARSGVFTRNGDSLLAARTTSR